MSVLEGDAIQASQILVDPNPRGLSRDTYCLKGDSISRCRIHIFCPLGTAAGLLWSFRLSHGVHLRRLAAVIVFASAVTQRAHNNG